MFGDFFLSFLSTDESIVDFIEHEGEDDGTDDIENWVFISEHAAGCNERGEDEHHHIHAENGGFWFGVFGESGTDAEENRSDEHDVSGRKAWLARTIRTSRVIRDKCREDFITKEPNSDHQKSRHNEPKNLLVNFFERATSNQLEKPQAGENAQDYKCCY